MICIPCNVCVHCKILIIKHRKFCSVSVFDGNPPSLPSSYPPPLPPIMYITFAGARFMQILICIALLNVLSAGWNPLKLIVSTALHQISVVTFSLFICYSSMSSCLKCTDEQPTKKRIFYTAILRFYCFWLEYRLSFPEPFNLFTLTSSVCSHSWGCYLFHTRAHLWFSEAELHGSG